MSFDILKTKLFSVIVLFLALTFQSVAQTNITVTGKIIDATTKAPISGASILQLGSKNGTVSKADGSFQLQASTDATLLISYLGFAEQRVKVASTTMTISLTPDDNVLDDVVVIGYGSVKRKDVTTAISSVSTKDLEQRPIVNVGQAIQGRAAGVSVIQPNGTPGGEMSIRVRGTTSFNGSNSPLYVVDGVPVDNIGFLSPNDITDIQILKDASSAAIYGSRAANGVVLITTKTGANGEAKISLNGQLTSNFVNNKFDVLNTQQYRDLQNEIGMIKLPENLTDQTDWFKETYKTGRVQNYQLSISDGTEKLKYYLSAGYLDEKGVLDVAYFKRYNFRANIENNTRSWLKINANINYSDNINNGIITGNGANRGGAVLSVINTPVYAPIWDPLNPTQYNTNFYGAPIRSPLENLARSAGNKNRENRLMASGSALITFIPELTLKSTFNIDRRNAINTRFLDPNTTERGRNQFGEGADTRNMNTVLTWDNVLTHNTSFGKHKLETMLGSSWTDSQYTNNYIYGSHYRNGLIPTLNAANKISWDGTGSGASQWSIMSYFARAMYNYEGKYLVTANMRADGSSKLYPTSRWGYFPSVSAAWRLSAESFMEDLTWINDLKVRGGWGQTGNQSGIGDYAYLQMYSITKFPWFEKEYNNAVPAIAPNNLRTKDLTWETTTQSNFGVDLQVLNNRIGFTADYYYKRTTNMLMYVSLPPGQGANNITRNEGIMSNRGFEFSVNSKNLTQNFIWNTDFNISFNRNKLEKLALQQIYDAAKTSDIVNQPVIRNTPGRSMSGFFGYISEGVDPETGNLIYKDLNNDGVITSADRTFIGDPNPKFTYGMTNSFSYKGFDLSLFIQGSYGNDIFNASRMETEGMYDGKNQTTKVLDRWQIPGQITNVPKAGYNIKNSTYFVEDGSYLRLKNVSLAYNISTEKLKKANISKIQPYLSISNLFTLTKYTGMDPEVNQWGDNGAVQGIDWGTYPQSRSFVIGVNLVF